MKALICHGAKDLRLSDVPRPEPGPGQALVRVRAGGVCGSDLHYYHDGGFGPVRIREPMVLGHEVAGELDGAAAGLADGARVTVNPSRPCGHCDYCRRAQYNQCLNMRFYGSAMPFPHVQGAFCEYLVVDAAQVQPVGDVSVHHAAMAEPLSVALHALRQAGPVAGTHVLVTGCGPIGSLCVAVARLQGALSVTATDIEDAPLATAAALGAGRAVNVAGAGALDEFSADKGRFDVTIEASGAAPALRDALAVTRPGGTLVQLGIGGEMAVPMTTLVAKEITLRGSFRFHEEFAWAAALIRERRLDLDRLLSDVFPVDDALAAFDRAGDRSRAMKVQITF